MADIEELQRRITAALERIGAGIETIEAGDTPAPAADPAQIDDLTHQIEELGQKLKAEQGRLEEEKVSNAQLTERVKTLKARIDDTESEIKSRLDAQSEATAQIDLELQRLRRVNEQLRENNRALREANEAGVTDPHLINKSMSAELDALLSARAAEIAESRAIAGELEQLLGASEPVGKSTEDA